MQQRDEDVQKFISLYREFLNMAEKVYDDYYTDEDELPATTKEGMLRAYKSKELLTWMGDVKQHIEKVIVQRFTKEDTYEHLKGKNPSLSKLQQELGLEID